MTSAERKLLLPFLRDVAKVPHVVLAREAERLLQRFSGKRPMAKAIDARRKRESKEQEERLSKREHRAWTRAECMKRAAGHCECGCGISFIEGDLWRKPEFDHFYGRRLEGEGVCWMLLATHHQDKTRNRPSRAVWDAKFKAHCFVHGYGFRSRLIKEAA